MDKKAIQRDMRLSAVRLELGKLNDADLKQRAADLGIGLEGDETREEIEFMLAGATVAKEEADAAAEEQRQRDEAERAEREAFYKTPAGKKQKAIDEQNARDNAVRAVHANFIRALPNAARSSGSFDVAPDSPDAGKHPVPDGRYRVAGSDWIVEFKGGKWSSANRAHAHSAPDWTEIADTPGGQVGVDPVTPADNG